MTPQKLLDDLTKKAQELFLRDNPSIAEIKDIITSIRQASTIERIQFKSLAEFVKNEMLRHAIGIPGLFTNLIPEESQTITPDEEPTLSLEVSFQEAVKTIVESSKNELQNLKLFFSLRLQVDEAASSTFKIALIYERECYYQPIKKKLEREFPDLISCLITDFEINYLRSRPVESNYIVIVLLTPKINEPKSLDNLCETIEQIIDRFDYFEHFVIRNLDVPTVAASSEKEKLYDEIKYCTSISLSNAELTNEEEKIIKKTFSGYNCPVLEYKILKGGKSGSKVLEIQPKTEYGTEHSKRYVVKFAPLVTPRKISDEARRFIQHIEPFSIADYSKDYRKTLTTEAIKYSYASTGSITQSYALADILTLETNPHFLRRREIFALLFEHPPFPIWEESREHGEFRVSDLYKDYVKPDKTFETISRIKNVDIESVKSSTLFKNFERIFNAEFSSSIQVCHGDLHSENAFYDSQRTYLIDFGFTDRRHSIIDHVTLECSIKFKHIPFYVETNQLEDVEREFLSSNSFLNSYKISSARSDIMPYFEIIKDIRVSALKRLRGPKQELQYLIGLFLVTFRQINFADLNQLYALKSAEILAEKISRDL